MRMRSDVLPPERGLGRSNTLLLPNLSRKAAAFWNNNFYIIHHICENNKVKKFQLFSLSYQAIKVNIFASFTIIQSWFSTFTYT